jgi:hypothetical protein
MLKVDYAHLEDDDGVSGFIVSRQFEGMSTLDRQGLIEEALRKAPKAFTPEERRRVLMIAGLTPAEYETVGARIRVEKVREMAGGVVEVLLHGDESDAQYVRARLDSQQGVQTTEPKHVSGAIGILMSFRAKGTKTAPLTKEKTVRLLKKDSYIEVMPNS